ncbi:MAG TPA: circularly permuted type 2 ATP-grasp protein [Pyrinomonadaceae bacterium]
MSLYESGRAARDWLEARIRSAPELNAPLFRALRAKQIERGLVHGARPICSYLSPLVLPRSLYEAIARAAETLAPAFERVSQAALEDEALMRELGLTAREETMARIDPGYKVLCVNSRLDTFIGATNFCFLEYNAESPAGLADQMLAESVMFDLPHMREFLSRYQHWRPAPHVRLLRSLVETYLEWGGEQERPSIAIVDWKGVATASEFDVLKAYFESEGYPVIICDPRELEYDGKRLTAGGAAIDIVYKRVIIHEFLEKFDETHPLARAYAERRVMVANSFRTKLAHKKASFAIISDPRYEYLFTPEQISCARRHIPWTRRINAGRTTYEGVEQDLLELVRREREQLVIKPNDDYGGHGVVIGSETTPQEWEQAIERGMEEPYVAQQRVAVEKVLMPGYADEIQWQEMLVDFDPFLFRNEMHGGLARLSSSLLCNVSSGGGVTALLVLEDEEPRQSQPHL